MCPIIAERLQFMNTFGGQYRRVYYQVRTPRDINAVVTNVAEREVIMQPNRKFKVLRIRNLDDYPQAGTEGGGNPILVTWRPFPRRGSATWSIMGALWIKKSAIG